MPDALRHVLIVDDDADYRKSIRFALQSFGCEFSEAGSISDAERKLKKLTGPLVIVLDLELDGETGTLLLEGVQQRLSQTRVIILTAHDELLEAETAQAYKVFSYLNKTVQFPVQAMKLALTRAFDELEEAPKSFLGSLGLEDFPEPIAYILHELSNFALEPMREFKRHLELVEAVIKFCSSIVLCEYLNCNNRLADLDEKITSNIKTPSLGNWFFLMNDVLKRRPALPDLHSLGVISDFVSRKNKRLLIEMITVRNEHDGHSAVHTEYEYGSLVDQYEQQICDLLESAKFFAQYTLCSVDSVRHVRGEYIYKIFDCNGVSPQMLPSKKSFDRMFPAEELLWIHKESGWLQSLHPLIVLADCPECKKKEIFFFKRVTKAKVDYVSSNTGHNLSSKALLADFESLLYDRAASTPVVSGG